MTVNMNCYRTGAGVLLICMAAGVRAQTDPARLRPHPAASTPSLGPVTPPRPQPASPRKRRPTVARHNAPVTSGMPAIPVPTRMPMLQLAPGDVHTLRFPSIRRIAVGNGKVVNATAISATEVLIIAESQGSSAMNVWDRRGHEYTLHIRVGQHETADGVKELESLLRSIPGVSVRTEGDHIIAEGSNLSGAARSRLDTLASRYPMLIDLTHPVTWEKMILFDVRIVEFNKQALSELGIRWSESLAGPAAGYARDWIHNPAFKVGQNGSLTPLPGTSFLQNLEDSHGYFGIAAGISSQIDLMARDGKAIVLAEPRLSARSGSSAHFLAGGEVPLPVRSDTGEVNVFFKEYGIILDIKPEAGGDGSIRASVRAEVSTIDPSTTVGGFPGFLKRQTSTEVNLREKETLVISGLVSSEMSNDMTRVPFISDIPILGTLFRSKNFRERQSELVFFVTPHLIDAESPVNQRLQQHIRQRMQHTRERLQGVGSGAGEQ